VAGLPQAAAAVNARSKQGFIEGGIGLQQTTMPRASGPPSDLIISYDQGKPSLASCLRRFHGRCGHTAEDALVFHRLQVRRNGFRACGGSNPTHSDQPGSGWRAEPPPGPRTIENTVRATWRR